MSKEYSYEIGYESLQKEWETHLKRSPRGISLAKKKSGIYLQFKTPSRPRRQYACACTFSVDGMHEAVRKSHLVKAKLTNMTSETEFWEWYKKEIEEESQLVNDVLTFEEAIKKVEDDFWSRLSRTKRKRSKNNPSDINSWRETYGKFYKHLPAKKHLSFNEIKVVIEKWEKGTRTYKYSVSAMKKLARANKRQDIYELLNGIDVTQTSFNDLQSLDLDKFLKWRNDALGITSTLHGNARLDTRRAWLWAFSIQIIYALRISEVFAIKNLFEPYTTKDGVVIPALNDPGNTTNLIYIGEQTIIGTKVKTGNRIAKPQIPPKYPDLMEVLDIKNPLVPNAKPKSNKPEVLVKFYSKEARTKLVRWNAPFTQTHADRHLGNINGMQAGIPQEVRAQSMGHTVQMNESVYKKRQSTQTTIDLLLNSNQNAIDFVTALTSIKNLVKTQPEQKQFAAKILSIIYQKSENEIVELL